ncbi:hypothetical protein Hanom_Chr00s089825g01798431 [Helianthus anomalus]
MGSKSESSGSLCSITVGFLRRFDTLADKASAFFFPLPPGSSFDLPIFSYIYTKSIINKQFTKNLTCNNCFRTW